MTAEELKRSLEALPDVIGPTVVVHGEAPNLFGQVTSPSFVGRDEGERQAWVWGHLQREFSLAALFGIEYVFTFAPGEWCPSGSSEVELVPIRSPGTRRLRGTKITADELKRILEALPDVIGLAVLTHGEAPHLFAEVTSPAFVGMDEAARSGLEASATGVQPRGARRRRVRVHVCAGRRG